MIYASAVPCRRSRVGNLTKWLRQEILWCLAIRSKETILRLRLFHLCQYRGKSLMPPFLSLSLSFTHFQLVIYRTVVLSTKLRRLVINKIVPTFAPGLKMSLRWDSLTPYIYTCLYCDVGNFVDQTQFNICAHRACCSLSVRQVLLSVCTYRCAWYIVNMHIPLVLRA